ncbi:hypothetical protein GFL54_19800 [Rhizobium laguerreae]|nr:hypothetical protein [Rhizobium laguerreae]NKM86500.1 hypothetical protein [Rhizobium laguerreae]NKN03738.1 hypothetical protein [Rhizobium laguerreae]
MQALPAKENLRMAKKRPAANLVMAFPAQMGMPIRRVKSTLLKRVLIAKPQTFARHAVRAHRWRS